MTDGVEVRIFRRDALFRKVRRLTPSVDEELYKAVKKGADEVADLARKLAPEDTGELKRSIHSRMAGDRVNIVGQAVADATHARWVEHGTLGGALGAQPPRPYMYPAYRLLRKRVQSRITRAINKAVKQVAAK
jgi:HK97 gp10 family phage protein